jgi:hypothetical protein
MINFLKNVNDSTPIVVVEASQVNYIEPPEKVKEMIKALETPCQNCGEDNCKENCEH